MNNERFNHCKTLIIGIPRGNIFKCDSFDSIDKIALHLKTLEHQTMYYISPREEFVGHCSNIQAWCENDYNTNILHSSLAFPLLKKLAEVGDSKARITLKEEAVKRLETGCSSVMLSLIKGGYLNLFTEEEISIFYDNASLDFLVTNDTAANFSVIVELAKLGMQKAKVILRNKIKLAFDSNDYPEVLNLISHKFLSGLGEKEVKAISLKESQMMRTYKPVLGRKYNDPFSLLLRVEMGVITHLDEEQLSILYDNVYTTALTFDNSNVNFPLMIELANIGMVKAKMFLKEKTEIAFENGDTCKITYFIERNYLKGLNKKESREFLLNFFQLVENCKDNSSDIKDNSSAIVDLLHRGYLSSFDREELSMLYDKIHLDDRPLNNRSLNNLIVIKFATLGLQKAKLFLKKKVEQAFETANFFGIKYLLENRYLETLKEVEAKKFLLETFQAIEENLPITREETETLELVMYLLEGNYLWRFERKELDSIYERFHLECFDPKQYSGEVMLDLDIIVLESIILKRELKKHILDLYSEMDLEEIYHSLRNGTYRTRDKTEFRSICLSLLEKIEEYKGRFYYFFTLSAFLDEVFRRGLFDDKNLIIEKIISLIFSQVKKDEESEWVSLIFQIIHSFEDLSFYSLILPRLLSVFDKLSSNYRASIFISILDDTRHTTFISDHFSVVYELLEKVLEKMSCIDEEFDDEYEFSRSDIIIGGARSLADLIYALNDTRLLKLFVEPIKKSLSEIICEIESKPLINYITTHISWLNDEEIRLTLLNAVRSTPNYKQFEIF